MSAIRRAMWEPTETDVGSGSGNAGVSVRSLAAWLDQLLECNDGDTYVIARMSIWGRWLLWFTALGYLLSRPDYSLVEDAAVTSLLIALAFVNAGYHWRLISTKRITGGWFLMFSACDLGLIVAATTVESVFQPFVYLCLFPTMASVSVAFSSFKLCVALTTLVARLLRRNHPRSSQRQRIGLAPDGPTLVAQIVMMFAVTLVVNMVTGYERTERLKALERERELHSERIELSQRIHDTSAQSAYMIGLGIDNALALANDGAGELRSTLLATSELSKSAMWELRQPIDMGLIYEGRELSQVLGAHARNFTTITSVPAEVVQTGVEPRLGPQQRARIMSIAHNALTNAHRHSGASLVTITLEFGDNRVCLSIVDDGMGLPENYHERGTRLSQHAHRGRAAGRGVGG